eukprot:83695-Lingulodinium_polyedra.AAC.1
MSREIEILSRTVGIDDRGYFIKADERHARTILEHLGMENASPVTSPEAEEVKEGAKEVVLAAE